MITQEGADLRLGLRSRHAVAVPGYAGHVGTSRNLSEEVTNDARSPAALLLGLSQYPRQRVPGCTKHFPRAARNIRPIQPCEPVLDRDWAQVMADHSTSVIQVFTSVIQVYSEKQQINDADPHLLQSSGAAVCMRARLCACALCAHL